MWFPTLLPCRVSQPVQLCPRTSGDIPPSSWHCSDPAPRSFTFLPTLSCLVATWAVVLPWVVGGLTPNRHLLLRGGSFSVLTGEEHPVSRARDAAKPPMLRVVPTTRDYPTRVNSVKAETPCPKGTRSEKRIKGGLWVHRKPSIEDGPHDGDPSQHTSPVVLPNCRWTLSFSLHGCREALGPHLGWASQHHSTLHSLPRGDPTPSGEPHPLLEF